MQEFTYAGVTIYYKRLYDDAVPIGLGRQADDILALVCRPTEAAEEDFLLLLEVQGCVDCQTLQRHEATDVEACLLCGGLLDWAEVGDWSPQEDAALEGEN